MEVVIFASWFPSGKSCTGGNNEGLPLGDARGDSRAGGEIPFAFCRGDEPVGTPIGPRVGL